MLLSCKDCGVELTKDTMVQSMWAQKKRECDSCRKARYKRWYVSRDRKSFRPVTLKKYGLTLNDYKVLLDKQLGCCAICGRSDSGNSRAATLYVDHDHKNGKVRGLLCHLCNCLLGLAKDNPSVLEKASIYLKER